MTSLVSSLTGGAIDKAHRFSDWAARPLSAAQMAYAAADVTWLRRFIGGCATRLLEEGRLTWVAEEMAILANPDTYRTDPETAWERLKVSRQQPALPGHGPDARRLAGAGGAAHQHPSPAPAEGRDADGDRRDRADQP